MRRRPRHWDFGFGDDCAFAALPARSKCSVTASWPEPSIQAERKCRYVMNREVRVVRVYDNSGHEGNVYRVLIDRPWPRSRSKGRVDHNEWSKGTTPSTELRRWHRHDPEYVAEFSQRYRTELALPPVADVVSKLRETNKVRSLVLLTTTRDVEHSRATVLRSVIVNANGS